MTPDSTSQRLARIEAQQERVVTLIEGLTKRLDERTAATEGWRSKIDKSLHGEGGQAGMVVRLDRLEQVQERAKWFARAVVGAILSLTAAFLNSILNK